MAMEKNIPLDFRCPISMELMKDPVTIFTGVTYERKNIERWFFTYKKKTCPATMQTIHNFAITPNHTLKRLMLAWQKQLYSCQSSSPPPPQPSINHDEMLSLLKIVESSPFKVSSLKKLRSLMEMAAIETKSDFIRCGGLQVLQVMVVQILVDTSDFASFRACEEALGVVHQLLPLMSLEVEAFELLSKPESMKSMAIVLQRGSAEARLFAVTTFRNMAKTSDYDWNILVQDQGIDFFKSLLELVSDEICTKASSCALELLIRILCSSMKSRLRAIEAGAVCLLIELLPESNGSRCEKMLHLIKLLCECAEGRLALVDHSMGIAAVSKKLLHVSNTATKIGVKIMWLISSLHPTERVLEEMLIYGMVKKLLALLHMEGPSSTKHKVLKMFRLHAYSWRRYPCFPSNLMDHLGSVNRSC
ncbi:U-box domain-containing protein [Cephalotus follicularis]|uniref:U-box domain-containing protein n=1 Tax=Cephalotus follicularis TaxID=3775 RepID=A0A1Q3DC62_CEPFO|nr:U-box domain-containing protein [Cephalotus follicularis]